ncbi:MAG: preprotein translocase subunit SecY, partial [Crocinitomicaceae bacterium]|nr:preprotein translocase subunit SecY [Crocinitomicaceae bacterium]
MKKFVDTIKNIWKVEELRNRILITLGIILVYRLGSFIILPGIDQSMLGSSGQSSGLVALLDLFAGGAFSKASIMALGIMPYISASIIMQLLAMAVPVVQKIQKEGESGRRKINGYTRVLTIVICAFQGPSYLQMYVISKGGV